MHLRYASPSSFVWIVVFFGLVSICFGASDEEPTEDAIHAASFSDESHGKIVWRVDRALLPWRGSYSFLAHSEPEHPTVLLSVSDAHTGVKVADCQTPVTPRPASHGWRSELEQAFHWHRVNWELNDDELQCNTTADLKSIRSALNSANSEAFIVRIQAAKGPKCIRNLHVEEEYASDCPPTLQQHSYQATHLNCGCPQANRDDDTLDGPLTFGSIRRKPIPPGRAPPMQESSSVEVPAPTFPRFHFTSSMERELEHTTLEMESITTPPTESQSKEEPAEPVTIPTPAPAEPPAPETEEPTSVTPAASTATSTSIPDTNCDTFECENNGTCSIETGKAQCSCSEGFGGDHCEKDLCADLGCQNGGSCQVRNGRAVCSCPRGLHGDKCHQLQPVCNPKCENGGTCSITPVQPICKCPHGYVGSNCNLRDLCSINSTCAQYGPSARCFKDASDLFRFSGVLQDASYSCQCPSQTGYMECSTAINADQPASRPINTPTETSVEIPRGPPGLGNGGLTIHPIVPHGPPGADDTSATPSTEADTSRTSASLEQQQEQSSEFRPAFPMHSLSPSAANPSPQGIIGVDPQFPRTNMPTTPAMSGEQSGQIDMEQSNLPTILPRPSSTIHSSIPPSSPQHPSTIQFTRLPDLSHILFTSTLFPPSSETRDELARPTTIPTTTNEDQDESEGDNGFERITQSFETPPTPTLHSTSPSSTTKSVEDSTETVQIGQEVGQQQSGEHQVGTGEHGEHMGSMGPEHAIAEETPGTEFPFEFHTMAPEIPEAETETPPPFTNSPTNPSTSQGTSTVPSPNSSEEESNSEANASDPSKYRRSNAWTWIIALSIVAVLIIAATIGGVFMARYVRRSRRLHGKYNPAREENAVSPTAYAMPMTSVTKEERLI